MSTKEGTKPRKMTPGQAAIVGGIAGALEITVAYPIEFSKVIMQIYPKYNGMGFLNVITYTIKNSGPFGLYKGYPLMLYAGAPKAYVRFGIFEYLTQNVFTTKSVLYTTLWGGIAGALEGLIVHVPVENWKIKLIHDRFKTPPQYKNMFHGIYMVAKEKGFNGLTCGTIITMIKEGSNHAIRFPLFLGLQATTGKVIHNNVINDLVAGCTTGLICVAINQPADVIKTNLQGLDAHKYNGIVDCAKQIIHTDGFVGMYRGVKPRMARVAIEVSVTFASYNAIKNAVLKYLDARE